MKSGIETPDLFDVDLDRLVFGLKKGHFTSVDLTIVMPFGFWKVDTKSTDIKKAYIYRILEVNDALHVVTEINPEAESIAAELDAVSRIRPAMSQL